MISSYVYFLNLSDPFLSNLFSVSNNPYKLALGVYKLLLKSKKERLITNNARSDVNQYD